MNKMTVLVDLLEKRLPMAIDAKRRLSHYYIHGEKQLSVDDHRKLITSFNRSMSGMLVGINALVKSIDRHNEYGCYEVNNFDDLVRLVGYYLYPDFETSDNISTQDIITELNSLTTKMFNRLDVDSEATLIDLAIEDYIQNIDILNRGDEYDMDIDYTGTGLSVYITTLNCINEIFK